MWFRHFTQDVPQCPISAHFIAIYICHFLFQFHQQKPHQLLYLSKIPIHVDCKEFVNCCSSPVVVVVVAVVVVVLVVLVVVVALLIMEVVVVLLLYFGGCDGCSAGGCGCGNSSISSTNSSSTTDISFLLYINLLLCNLEL